MEKYGFIAGAASTSLIEYVLESIILLIKLPFLFLDGLFAGSNGFNID